MPRIDDEIRATAARCRHEATRKINHLATGLCPSGPEGHFAGFSPQGRKDITGALAGLLLPLGKFWRWHYAVAGWAVLWGLTVVFVVSPALRW